MPDTIKTLHFKQNNQRGNAMIYVLIALALIGFLTMTLTRQNNQDDGQNLNDEQAEIYANDLIEYAASAQQVIDKMLFTGSTVDQISFIEPSDPAFNIPPHVHKIFHPQGGGLIYQDKLLKGVATSPSSSYWKGIGITNVEWTPTASSDIIFSALRINKNICEKINLKITGTSSIPALTAPAVSRYFEIIAVNSDLTIADCPDCQGYSNLCVSDSTLASYAFYNVLVGR